MNKRRKRLMNGSKSRMTSLALALVVSICGAEALLASQAGRSQPPAMAPDETNAMARVLTRRLSDGAYEIRIGDDTYRSSRWLDIEKHAINLLPGRTITFVDADGVAMHVSPRAMFGVLLEPALGALAAQLSVKPGEALIVTEVQPGLPAARAGVEVYDVIVECNGQRPMTNHRFSEIMAASIPGDTVNVVLVRHGRETEVEVRLDKYDPVAMANVREPLAPLGQGMTREEILAKLQQASTGAGKVEVALPRDNPRNGAITLPDIGPQFADPALKALQEELAGIKEQLRRIEGALESLLLLEQQRQPTAGRSIGG